MQRNLYATTMTIGVALAFVASTGAMAESRVSDGGPNPENWFVPEYELPTGAAAAGTWRTPADVDVQADSVLTPVEAPYYTILPAPSEGPGGGTEIGDAASGMVNTDPSVVAGLPPIPTATYSSRFDLFNPIAAEGGGMYTSVRGCVDATWTRDASGEETCPVAVRDDIGVADFRLTNTSSVGPIITYTVTYEADLEFDGAAPDGAGGVGAYRPCSRAPSAVTVASGTLGAGSSATITWPGGGPVIDNNNATGATSPAAACRSGLLTATLQNADGYSKVMSFRIYQQYVPL